eukprot:355016-Chlamydomonas_euryale.AAC.6
MRVSRSIEAGLQQVTRALAILPALRGTWGHGPPAIRHACGYYTPVWALLHAGVASHVSTPLTKPLPRCSQEDCQKDVKQPEKKQTGGSRSRHGRYTGS